MKRIIAMSVCIVMLFCMSPVSRADLGERLSFNEISAMSNYMNGGYFIKSGNWIYGLDYYGGKSALSMRSASDLSRTKYISKGIVPSSLFVERNCLYYVAEDLNHNNNTSIRCVKLSGDGETILISENDIPESEIIRELIVYNGHIYFSVDDENPFYGGLYKANLDGTKIEKIINLPVYRPFIINDKVYYLFNGNLSECDLDGNHKKVIIKDAGLCYITDGVDIYFETFGGVIKKYSYEEGKTISLHLKTGIDAIAYDGYQIYFEDPSDEYRLYSYNPVTEEVNFVSDDTYIDKVHVLFEGMLAYLDYSKDYSSVDHVYVVGFDGSKKWEMK